jgi:hypothetical protein
MRRNWILLATIIAVAAVAGCGGKKQASQDTAANTQRSEVQTPAQTPAQSPAETPKQEQPKSPAQDPPKKVEKPKPAPVKPEEKAPPKPQVVNRDVTVPTGTEIPVTLREKISTEGGKPGQAFTAVTKAPVRVEGLEPIPVGSVVSGLVTVAEQAGRVGGKAKLTIIFKKVDLPDGKSLAISAEPLKFEGEGTAKGDVEKVVGGAVGGGILGGVLGGKKGAGKGAAAGTIAGGILAVATRGNDIVLEPGKEVPVKLDAPVTIPMMVTVMPGENP